MENKESWPKEAEALSCDKVQEKRKKTVIAAAVNYESIIDYSKFSSLNKLLRVVAYVLRFMHNIRCKREKRRIGAITVEEVKRAKMSIIKLIQREELQEDIKALKCSGKIQRGSKLLTLHSHLDSNGILRGGRLKQRCPKKLSTLSCFLRRITLQH